MSEHLVQTQQCPEGELARQLRLEAAAMARYALANGRAVPAPIILVLDSGPDELPSGDGLPALVQAHADLCNIVIPATPAAILLLERERQAPALLRALGPVSIIRELMAVTLLCMLLFIAIATSPLIAPEAGNILETSGLPLLLNLLFFLCAAGLGAGFAGLYTAHRFVAQGRFDPTYAVAYRIRLCLGLVAGLVLAVLVHEDAIADAPGGGELIEAGFVRPVLAMLGGFSADLLYTILSRLVVAVETLFQGAQGREPLPARPDSVAGTGESQMQREPSMAPRQALSPGDPGLVEPARRDGTAEGYPPARAG